MVVCPIVQNYQVYLLVKNRNNSYTFMFNSDTAVIPQVTTTKYDLSSSVKLHPALDLDASALSQRDKFE